jgi:hypothetical protein
LLISTRNIAPARVATSDQFWRTAELPAHQQTQLRMIRPALCLLSQIVAFAAEWKTRRISWKTFAGKGEILYANQ